jgi:signal transduction histidine kinase/CheY-like chemotaxis protein
MNRQTASGLITANRIHQDGLADFIELNPSPLLVFRADGGLSSWNNAAQELARENDSVQPSEILPEDTPASVARCATERDITMLESALGPRTYAWKFFPLAKAGLVGCSVTDITERVILEQQLRETQKSDLVGRLSAGVARDFNNVLTVIQGEVGLVRADPDLKPSMEASLRAVSVAAQRACKLLSQLLAFSNNETGEPALVNLNEAITELSPLLSRGLGEDITFQFDYASALPPLRANPRYVQQTVLNLALNARQAMPEGGQIFLQTALLELGPGVTPTGAAGTFVCLTCTDTGAAIGSAPRPTDQPFARQEGGTTLRLEITERLVKQCGGWMEVHSQATQGSTVKVYWPPSRLAVSSQPEVLNGTETVLVVEDESAVRLTMRNILERYGYQVLEAANGVEALGVWHRYNTGIALMLTDMVLPSGLSGEELAEKFHSQKPDLRIIYTSGYGKDIAGRGSSPLEGALFLEKPFDADQLIRLVRYALDQANTQKV